MGSDGTPHAAWREAAAARQGRPRPRLDGGALTRTLQRAEAAAQLTAGIVHDVRNALQVVIAHADLLSGSQLLPAQMESVRAIALAGGHADDVLRDLMTLVRPAASTTSIVNGTALVEEQRPLIRQVVRKQLECVFDLDPDAWPVSVESHQLEAALINLAANARDATPQGGQLLVSVRNIPRGAPLPTGLPGGHYVGFSVADTGTGMTPLVLERATEAFFTTKAAQGGTGLGLSMVQAFAARAGGALRIDSTPGRGTTVEILLPRSRHAAPYRDDDVAPRRVVVEKIRRQTRAKWLRDVLDTWHAACPNDGLPHPDDVEVAIIGHVERSLVVLVEEGSTPTSLRLHRMGDDLVRALAATAIGQAGVDGSMFSTTLGDVYRRVALSRLPSSEHVRYRFGDGPPADFERLVLPAASDGQRVSHLIGVVALSTDSSPDTETVHHP